MTLKEASQQTGLSERWIREYIYRELLYVRKGPWNRYCFEQRDIERILAIHRDQQEYMALYHPHLYPYIERSIPDPYPNLTALRGRGGN